MGAERGWQQGVHEPTHGHLGQQAQLRVSLAGSADENVAKTAELLPSEAQKEAHREIEITRRLTRDELEAAMKTLESQGAERKQVCEIEQKWYDTKELCNGITWSSTTLATQTMCWSMQIRVRKLTYANGTVEYHWAIKIPAGSSGEERIEIEDIAPSWDEALTALNNKIALVLNTELHAQTPPKITEKTPATMSLKKTRVSYRYPEPFGEERFPCTGVQIDFDVVTEVAKDGKVLSGSIDKPVLIIVDVEGPVLNGNAAGLTAEEARKVPSVENCAWCLSFPQNSFDLFKTVDEMNRAK